MQRMSHRPREPDRGPAAGAFGLGRYPGAAPRARPRIREPEGRDAVGTAAATCFVGVDVAKATLDACLLRPRGPARAAAFANDAAGHAALIEWADRHAGGAVPHF